MPSVQFESTRRFDRCYRSLHPDDKEHVKEALRRFASNPRSNSLRAKKIDTKRNIWSMRASRSIRITFNWEADQVVLRAVANSHDIYRDP